VIQSSGVKDLGFLSSYLQASLHKGSADAVASVSAPPA
jgi:hypothetical protein